MSRDDAYLSNVVYQISYQKALQSQISGIMSDLHGKEFNTISEYLVKSYENGYIGSMYDIHGQGITIIVPIDQKNVVRAITHDTKLSSDLYTSLGKDINKLSRQISAEISRGFSTAMTYQDIARSISDKAKIPQNRAMTIARTEAHRIQSESSLDAQRAAVKVGADVKKQWDAFLDGLTREAHQRLDGQIREVEEPFEVDGHEAMFPGGFGVPELDINCRCALLQRASWALDQAELGILKERAAYFGIDKAENFEEFKILHMGLQNKHKDGIMEMDLQYFATIPERKLTEYALNPEKSTEKAKAFQLALGYNLDNHKKLIKNVLDNLDESKLVEKGDIGYGMRYEGIIEIVGENGKKANVLTVWIDDDGEKRLTSIYVTNKKVRK